MGKRKLQGTTYYQCDWTGFPMAQSNCYMPTWTPEGKLVKRGSYCNWESVLAHAAHEMDEEADPSGAVYAKVMAYVAEIAGPDCQVAPHFMQLSHMKGSMDAEAYNKACCLATCPVMAVKLPDAGEPYEFMLHPTDSKTWDMAVCLKQPSVKHTPEPTCFQTVRKGKQAKDREINVVYWAGKNGLPYNALASAIFKMQIYGDVVITQTTKEASFMPRTRYVNYNLADFEEAYTKKKKQTQPTAMNSNDYGQLKTEMQTSLDAFEKTVSAQAVVPAQLAGAGKMPPPNGKDLAALAQHKAQVPVLARSMSAMEPPPPKKRRLA